ncbi:hypothetical protein CRYUN_Cryun18bG0058800 [Craigia yunnanensis]
MITEIPNLSMDLMITREGLLEIGKSCDKEREKDGDHHRERDKDRERSERRDRGRDRDGDDYHKNRDYDSLFCAADTLVLPIATGHERKEFAVELEIYRLYFYVPFNCYFQYGGYIPC